MFYHPLNDSALHKKMVNALRKSARNLRKENLVQSSFDAGLVRLKGGKTAQVMVQLSEFDEVLLEEKPITGGLLVNAKNYRRKW